MRFCQECNAENAFPTVLDSITSSRHPKEKRTKGQTNCCNLKNDDLQPLAEGNSFQHDLGQLLLGSGPLTNVLNYQRVIAAHQTAGFDGASPNSQ